jgi:hypothetical protein
MLTFARLAVVVAMQAQAPDSRWTLSYRDKSTNDLMRDLRAMALVYSRVPQRSSSQRGVTYLGKSLAYDVRDGLSGPPDPVVISQGRYVAISACVPHFCEDRGFFWVDTKTGVGLGAFFDFEDTLRVGSTSFSNERIPAAARAALMDWLTDRQLKPAVVQFMGPTGGWRSLDPSEFQPQVESPPAASGPSFDCSRGTDLIETMICGDTALSAADLDLFNLERAIRWGSATLPARRELADMQRDFKVRRDAKCSASATVKICLGAEYREQTKRLRNWIPKPSPSPFIGEWKLDPSKSRLPDEMKVQRKIGNTYVFDFGGGPETISVDGTDQPGLDATLLSVKAEGPRTWMVQRKKGGRVLLTATWKLSNDESTLTDYFRQVEADGSVLSTDYVYRRTKGTGFASNWESVKETVTSPFFMTVKAFQDSGFSFVSPFGTTNAALDSRDHASQGGGLSASSSVRQTDDRTLVMTIRHDGRVAATEQMVLATDFKTMTLTVHVAARDKPTVLAFERK